MYLANVFSQAAQRYIDKNNLSLQLLRLADNSIRMVDGDNADYTFTFNEHLLESVTIGMNGKSNTIPMLTFRVSARLICYKIVKELLDAIGSLHGSELAMLLATGIDLNGNETDEDSTHFVFIIPSKMKEGLFYMHDTPPNLSIYDACMREHGTLRQAHIKFMKSEYKSQDDLLVHYNYMVETMLEEVEEDE